MTSAALQVVTFIETLFLVFCFAGILFHTLRTTGRASKGVLLLIVLVSWQAWAIPIGILCFPVVAAVLFVVVRVAELAVRSSVIATQGRTLKHCHSCEGASVYNPFKDRANACQTRAQRRALRKSLQKLRKKGLKAERQAENMHRKYWIAFLVIDVAGVFLQVMSLICFLVVLRALIMISIFVGTVIVCGFIVRCFCVIWPSDPLIVEATEPQVPDPEIDGGELVLDDPPASRSHAEIERTSSATGQEGEEASAATGHAVGGSTTSCAGLGATLSLPGLNINWPFSQLILAGVRTVETRRVRSWQ